MMLLASASTQTASDPRTLRAKTDQQHIALLQGIARGEQESLATFYEQTNRLVFGLATRVLNDRSVAEEVTMDVYMQVWKQAAQFETLRGAPLSWLMTIARTRAIDRLRASSHLRHESETLDNVTHKAANEDSPEKKSLYAEQRRIVRAALQHLSAEQRALIEAAYFEGLSQTELAEKFALPLGTVKTRVRAGMQILKKYFAATLT